MSACDNCGRRFLRTDEILCLRCKPHTRTECLDAIDAAYWAFTRQARAQPPAVAVPWAYARLRDLKDTTPKG